MSRIMTVLMTLIPRLLGGVLIGAVLLNFVNVVGRSLFNVAFLSADELEVFGLVFITFLGAAVVTWREQNLRMDVIQSVMPYRLKIAARILEAVVGVLLCGFVAVISFRYANRIFVLEQASDMAHVPMWVPHSAVVVGFTLIAAAIAVHGVLAICGRTNADGANSKVDVDSDPHDTSP